MTLRYRTQSRLQKSSQEKTAYAVCVKYESLSTENGEGCQPWIGSPFVMSYQYQFLICTDVIRNNLSSF